MKEGSFFRFDFLLVVVKTVDNGYQPKYVIVRDVDHSHQPHYAVLYSSHTFT